MLQDQDSVMESQTDSILTLKTPTNSITVQEATLTCLTAVQALCLITAVSAVPGPNTKGSLLWKQWNRTLQICISSQEESELNIFDYNYITYISYKEISVDWT